MTLDESLLLMSRQLYYFLGLMFARFRHWMPQTDYPRCSAGMSTGGVVGYESASGLEDEADCEAIAALEAAFDDLTLAERTMIEQVMGIQPWVWTAREGVLESAVRKLEKKLRSIGAL